MGVFVCDKWIKEPDDTAMMLAACEAEHMLILIIL